MRKLKMNKIKIVIVTAAVWVVCVACGSLLQVFINFDFSNF